LFHLLPDIAESTSGTYLRFCILFVSTEQKRPGMKFMESLRFHDMAWAAQTVNGETAITMAENRASRLREADARDDEAIAKAHKNFLAYQAEMSRRVSRAHRRFRDHFSRGDCSDRDRFEEAAKDFHRSAKQADDLVGEWFRHMEDDRYSMSCQSGNRHAEVERLDRLDEEEDRIVFLLNKANQRRMDWINKVEQLRKRIKLDSRAKEESHRDELARARDDSIKMEALPEATVHGGLATKDESFKAKEEADSKAAQASKAEEGSQDLQIAQGKGNKEGKLALFFFRKFKILAAMLAIQEQQGAAKLAIQDGPRARRRRQGALLWIYDPGGQLVV
jgi:hypothetical protein